MCYWYVMYVVESRMARKSWLDGHLITSFLSKKIVKIGTKHSLLLLYVVYVRNKMVMLL